MNKINAKMLEAEIRKGSFQPNMVLSNMGLAYFQDDKNFAARSMFPLCPVQLSTSYYYKFGKGDLMRDNVKPKPQYGKVAPAIFSNDTDSYRCIVDQVIIGIDEIDSLNYQRQRAPWFADPRRAKVRFVAEQMKIHMEHQFAKKFFQSGVWSEEWTGQDSSASGKQFIKFTSDNSDPVALIDQLCDEVERSTGRRPNRLGLGADTFTALKNHPAILERVKYSGGTANPATVNERVLETVFGIERVRRLSAVYNSAGYGQEDSIEYICDENAALLCYATDTPAIDEPSAGYTFTWDMLNNGQFMPIVQYPGEGGTHTEFIEGLMATDMQKTADDLAVFLKDCT
nr:hypothetical protein [uncultured Agathobaculum sp.]